MSRNGAEQVFEKMGLFGLETLKQTEEHKHKTPSQLWDELYGYDGIAVKVPDGICNGTKPIGCCVIIWPDRKQPGVNLHYSWQCCDSKQSIPAEHDIKLDPLNCRLLIAHRAS